MIFLKGKLVAVSGGGLIGREIAVNFARAGADIFVLDLNLEEVEAMKGAVNAICPDAHIAGACVDLREMDSIQRAFEEITSRAGGIDVLVNNAAVFSAVPVLKSTVDEWERMFSVNARGTFFMMQTAAKEMRKRGGGKIINLASSDAIFAESPYAVYNATKAAIISFSRTAAIELAPHQITVNAIAPGIVNAEVGQNAEVRQAAIERRIPQGKIATPRNIADGAVFLGSSMADYITGEVLVIDGGLTIDGTIREANTFLEAL